VSSAGKRESKSESEFDDYADDYESALAQGLSVSGEGQDYFAHGRLAFLAECLRAAGHAPRKVMDFGCGTGAAIPLMRELIKPKVLVGVDMSGRSVERAAKAHGAPGTTFAVNGEYTSSGDFDLVYTNGVFHHIPLAERPGALAYIRGVLRPGGLFALWENNPWSLGARYVMSKIPFDKDAIMLSAAGARKLARENGFRALRTDYKFIFPAALRALRPLEELLRWTPAGAQYQVLFTKV
jgi:SAM-dependent methyltransferase